MFAYTNHKMMKSGSQKSMLNLLAMVFKGFFWLHLAVVIFLTAVNFLAKDGPNWYLTARGNANVAEHHWKPTPVTQKDTIGQSATVLISRSAFVRIDYSNIGKALQSKALLVILIDLIYLWSWLFITYSLMKILNSLNRDQIFEAINIKRLRWIAFATGFIWVFKVLRDFWFARLLNQTMDPGEATFYSISRLDTAQIFYGLVPMLFVLVLAEIFAYGLKLKQENDLTI